MAGIQEIKVPDIGGESAVDVVEVLVAVGDTVAVEDSLITLESDKASMPIPSTHAGVVKEVHIAEGDTVSEGALIVTLELSDAAPAKDEAAPPKEETSPKPEPQAEKAPEAPTPAPEESESKTPTVSGQSAPPMDPVPTPSGKPPHAGPGVRKFARELGVDLSKVSGTGRKGRIMKTDVQTYVKGALAAPTGAAPQSGSGIPPIPAVDFSKFGPIQTTPLSRIRKVSAANLHRSWVNVPHVTQHDEADITEMDAFRKSMKDEAAKRGTRLTPLAFLMKACVAALREYPDFNASLDPSGENLIHKQYYHLGIAVETPNGLVVPVIRDVDQKSLYQLADELGEVSKRMRDGKIKPADMQGACFTISSLGGIGGTAFTPIVNAPEVAILGVSRSSMKPVWKGGEFVPRLMLPLSLSYDHRVIDGAAAARFTSFLAAVLGDIRRLLL